MSTAASTRNTEHVHTERGTTVSTDLEAASTTDLDAGGRPTTTPAPPTDGWSLRRVLFAEAADELRSVVREPITLFFSVALPVGFFAFFASAFGGQQAGGTTVAVLMLATFGTFGVMGTAMITPGLSLAEDRERGWLRTRMVSATPLPVVVAAKVVATVPHAIGVMALMTLVAVTVGGASLEPLAWVRLVAVLVVGSLPFALLGVAVGALASFGGAMALLQAVYFTTSVGSGLLFPLAMLPGWFQEVAPFLLPYHLSRLGTAQVAPEMVTAGDVGTSVLVLLAATAALGAFAVWALRRARS